MSAQTLQAIHEAIAAHRQDTADDDSPAVLIDWIIGYAVLKSDDGVCYEYAVHHNSPHSSLGLAHMTTALLEGDLDL